MAETQISERSPRAVICLEGSLKLWKLLKKALDGQEGPSEFIPARSKDTAAEVLALCRRLAPALVLIEDSRIQVLPFKQLRDMISRRDIQILVVSDTTDDASYEEYFRMGCAGVLPHSVNHQTLKKALLAVREGELWLPRKVLSKIAQEAFLKSTTRKITPRNRRFSN